MPEGVKTLGKNCFVDEERDVFDVKAYNLVLPKSLRKIEENAFEFCDCSQITVAEGNKYFEVKEGGLYTKDGKRLIYKLCKG